MQKAKLIKLWLPLFGIFILSVLFFSTGAHKLFTLSSLRDHFSLLERQLASHWWVFSGLFILTYSIAVSIPAGVPVLLNVLAGMLFPLAIAIFYVCLSELIGGLVIFYYANSALGQWFAQKSHGKLARILAGIRRNGVFIVLGLRVACVWPCWLINLVSGLSQLRLSQYVVVTFIGSIPAATIFSIVGRGLRNIVATPGDITLKMLWRVEFVGPLLVLFILIIGYRLFQQFHQRS